MLKNEGFLFHIPPKCQFMSSHFYCLLIAYYEHSFLSKKFVYLDVK